MPQIITFCLLLLTLAISKKMFGRWFNHLNIYAAIWSVIIFLYQMKLMSYIEISSFAWEVILYGYLTFVLGTITVFVARANYGKKNCDFQSNSELPVLFFLDGKILKILILIFAFVGLVNAIQHWYILIQKFGDIKTVLVKANLVYRLRTDGEIKGVIPYLYIASYVAVVLAGIYTAYKNKITLTAVFPFLSIIIKEFASFGRAGILIGFLQFVISFFLFKYYLSSLGESKRFIITKKNAAVAFAVIIIVFVGGATLVKSFRGTYETFKASSSSLKQFNSGALISPSIYLYASSHIGVLSKYFEKGSETAMFGENSLQPVYNLLSKFEVVDHPSFFQKGYWIPMWTNTGTYLREIHADFGDVGLLIFPFFLGLLTTFYWFKFFEQGKMRDFIILVYLFLIVAMSFLVMITRTSVWFLSLLSLLIILPLAEKFCLHYQKRHQVN
ncbi:MAG: O-antigen polymerase [Ignavibacteria bacterium]|nr:O-antigen polymerase [Ignavibacteria bacterium]